MRSFCPLRSSTTLENDLPHHRPRPPAPRHQGAGVPLHHRAIPRNVRGVRVVPVVGRAMLPPAQRMPARQASRQAVGASGGVSGVGSRGALSSLIAAANTNAESVTSRASAAAFSLALVAFVVRMLMSALARSLAGFGGRPPGCLGLVIGFLESSGACPKKQPLVQASDAGLFRHPETTNREPRSSVQHPERNQTSTGSWAHRLHSTPKGHPKLDHTSRSSCPDNAPRPSICPHKNYRARKKSGRGFAGLLPGSLPVAVFLSYLFLGFQPGSEGQRHHA